MLYGILINAGNSECDCHDMFSTCLAMTGEKSARNDNLRCNIQNVNKGGIPNVIIKI
jgi:hypothetical protein